MKFLMIDFGIYYQHNFPKFISNLSVRFVFFFQLGVASVEGTITDSNLPRLLWRLALT